MCLIQLSMSVNELKQPNLFMLANTAKSNSSIGYKGQNWNNSEIIVQEWAKIWVANKHNEKQVGIMRLYIQWSGIRAGKQ